MTSTFLALLASAIAIISLVSGSPTPTTDVHLELIPDIESFKAANPDLKLLPLDVSRPVWDLRAARQQISYTLGSRQSGDQLVGAGSDLQSWGSQQDVALNIQYPTAGTGAVVTYVQVVVDQSSSYGRGYVVSGGIGQRSIKVVIEAYSTTYLGYDVAIYGK